jgi:enamine deaminase RidA (YjgF/YER057c/UK114 family)
VAGQPEGIVRHEIGDGRTGGPILSRAVVHGDVVYLCGVTPDAVGDIRTQTRQVLERIDALLALAGTRRSKLLTAQIWLSDMANFAEFNAEWNAWVDPLHPPARACVRADLVRSCLVEIMVTAAR